MVLVRGLGGCLAVVLLVLLLLRLLLLLSLLCVVFAAGPLLVFHMSHSSVHRAIFKTLVKRCSYPGVSVSATGPLRVSRTGPRHRRQTVIGRDERRLGGKAPKIEILCRKRNS